MPSYLLFLTLLLLYGTHCLAASIDRGVLISATWGRFGGSGDDAATQRKGYSFRAAGNLDFTLALFGLGVFFGLLPCHKLANEVWAGSVAKDVDDVDWDT